MKQCLEAFAPELKWVLLKPNIKKHVSNMEKQGVVPSRVVEVCCTTTKKGNRKGMCTFYFCSRPTQLLGNMLRRMFLDNSVQPSISFSSLTNVIVVAVGFDKSDSDFVGTWRACNRLKGNSSLCVCCLVLQWRGSPLKCSLSRRQPPPPRGGSFGTRRGDYSSTPRLPHGNPRDPSGFLTPTVSS